MALIGFIGLGHMGLPMAINLVKQGHQVTGFDLQPEAIARFVEAGGIAAHSKQEAAMNQSIVVTMLQTGEHVAGVCLGEGGIFSVMSPHTLFVDCSTIDVAQSRQLHDAARNASLHAVDAPVSGGVVGAAQATLTFMVGGDLSVFERVKPILLGMGKTIIHTGEAGSGQAAKQCNNMILGISMIAVSEAFLLAEKLGLSPQKLAEVVTQASGQCWVMNKYVPVPDVLPNVPANHGYQPGFTNHMMLKDLRLAEASARASGLSAPLGTMAAELYAAACEKEGGLDFSSIIKYV